MDVLRGLVMFLMLFVNDVASVPGAPAWMKHFFPEDGDGMTFVDVVFPAFLFMVGMSVPLAFAARVDRGQALTRIALDALVRVGALLLLGVLMVNMSRVDIGWRDGVWPALVYLCAIATWTRWPVQFAGLIRAAGAAGLIALIAIFRDGDGGWLRTSWWGILGLIGWAYLVAFVGFLIFRTRIAPLVGTMALLYAVSIADRTGQFDNVSLDQILDIGSMLGGHGAIAIAGVILTCLAVLPTHLTESRRLLVALTFGGALAVSAMLLEGLYGINKNAATPAWCLWSSAITCWTWVAVHWLTDTLGCVRITAWLRDMGQNALLAYLVHPLFYAILAGTDGTWYWSIGTASPIGGILRALVVAGLITAGVAWMRRRGMLIRL